jgi:hypothetical protein
VPTIPASAIAAMPRRMLPTPLELLSFARISDSHLLATGGSFSWQPTIAGDGS